MFAIERIIPVPRSEVLRAWLDPEVFKRWIVPPGLDLTSFDVALEPGETSVWTARDDTDDAQVVFTINNVSLELPQYIDGSFFVSNVPGMLDEHPVDLSVILHGDESSGGAPSTEYKLELTYYNATLWQRTSQVGVHTFWLDATERLARLLEQTGTQPDAAACPSAVT